MKRLSKHLSIFLSLVIGIMCIVSLSGFATAESSMDEALIHDGVTVSEPFIDPDLVGTTLEETQQPGEITPFNAYGERHVYAGTYTT